MLESRLPLGLRVVFHELQRIVNDKRALCPGARVAIKENARGEVVLAIVIPPRSNLPKSDPPTRGR